MFKKTRFFFYVIIVIALTGCNITKQSTVRKYETVSTTDELDYYISNNRNTAKGMIINGAKIRINTRQQTNRLRANFKIKPDSAMLVSLSNSLGIEIVRAVITPDSIKFIDRINRNYLAGKYPVIAAMYNIPVDYKLLQDALIDVGSMYFQSTHYPEKNYKSYQGFYNFKKETNKLTFHYQVDNEQYFIRGVSLNFHKLPQKISINYSNYTKFDQFFFPMDVSTTIFQKEEEAVQVDINYSDLRFEPVDITLKVPSSYHRIYP
ncbi:MAG TPA: DUF4292 domain-containing protein [Bacteroidales bacterium]|nr:DUF4292 domain-containing protein [Bacteroidales bacterium]